MATRNDIKQHSFDPFYKSFMKKNCHIDLDDYEHGYNGKSLSNITDNELLIMASSSDCLGNMSRQKERLKESVSDFMQAFENLQRSSK